jgi:hypothetical protein
VAAKENLLKQVVWVVLNVFSTRFFYMVDEVVQWSCATRFGLVHMDHGLDHTSDEAAHPIRKV